MKEDLEAIVPVAGYSQRMGAWKPEIIYRGIPVLTRVVELALKHSERVLVVTGHRQEDALALLPRDRRVHALHNEAYSRGMFSSIQCALGAIEAESFLVFMGDMPEVPDAVVERLKSVVLSSWARPVYKGRPGHPVRIHRRIIPELLALNSKRGEMRQVLRRHEGVLIDTDHPGVYVDLDTPEDLERLRKLT